jgi:cell division protein FtsQ
MAAGSRRPTRARAAVVPLRRARREFGLAQLLPSGRSIAVALGLLCFGLGAYALARETSLFAVRSIDVSGARPALSARVRAALRPFLGKSLVSLDGAAVRRALVALPVVAAARYDRTFPHTLQITIRPERPLLVVRRGPEAWLVSVRGRVMKELHGRAYPWLPRMWIPASVELSPGILMSGPPTVALRALRPLRRDPFMRQVRAVRVAPRDVRMSLRSGLRLRLGSLHDLGLKLAIGERVAAEVGPVSGYADITVPERPVVAAKAQVSG